MRQLGVDGQLDLLAVLHDWVANMA